MILQESGDKSTGDASRFYPGESTEPGAETDQQKRVKGDFSRVYRAIERIIIQSNKSRLEAILEHSSGTILQSCLIDFHRVQSAKKRRYRTASNDFGYIRSVQSPAPGNHQLLDNTLSTSARTIVDTY